MVLLGLWECYIKSLALYREITAQQNRTCLLKQANCCEIVAVVRDVVTVNRKIGRIWKNRAKHLTVAL